MVSGALAAERKSLLLRREKRISGFAASAPETI
jgi:hypothetical protein